MLKGFRDFIAKGSVIDLAVGIVIGAAFTALVGSFVANIINPLVGALGAKSLNEYYWCIKAPCGVDAKTGNVTGVAIGWGSFLSAIITFLITAAVIYYVFVVPMNKFRARNASPEEEAEAEEIALLKEIRDALQAR